MLGITGFVLDRTGLVLNIIGFAIFVLHWTESGLNMNGFFFKFICHNLTVFVLNKTAFVLNMTGIALNIIRFF